MTVRHVQRRTRGQHEKPASPSAGSWIAKKTRLRFPVDGADAKLAARRQTSLTISPVQPGRGATSKLRIPRQWSSWVIVCVTRGDFLRGMRGHKTNTQPQSQPRQPKAGRARTPLSQTALCSSTPPDDAAVWPRYGAASMRARSLIDHLQKNPGAYSHRIKPRRKVYPLIDGQGHRADRRSVASFR